MLYKQQEEHQKELLSTQIEIQHQTMQHIGREIHDNIGQKLTLASLYTQQLAYENKAPQINDSIENISVIINHALVELRKLSKSLTDNSVARYSISKLLQTECDSVKDIRSCKVTFSSNVKKIDLSYETKSVLLRILQEFLQNSIKHSECKHIIVTLNKESDVLLFDLKDDGKGFDTQAKSNGIGLSNMKKRAEIIGSSFYLHSDHNGTKLTLHISL